MKSQIRKFVLGVVTFLLMAGMAFGRHPKIAPDLDNVDPGTNVDVIVQFTQAPTAWHHAKVLARGGVLKGQLDLVKAGAYKIKRGQLENLARDPSVVYISPDRKIKGMLDLTAAAVNAPTAWNSYGLDGTGIGIAIIDSGVTLTGDLKKMGAGSSRIFYSQDFTGQGVTTDSYGHGTHVAGIAAGNGKASSYSADFRSFIGMAPEARIINLRVLDQNGQGTDSQVIAALQQAVALQNQYNIRVINLSLGRPVFESYKVDPLCQAVEAAWKAGIVVAVAAGNDGRDDSAGTNGYGTIYAPGNDPYVITVGAMKTMGTPQRNDDLIASYSSKGPTVIDHIIKPDIVAPGNQVVSDLASTSATLFNSSTQVLMSYFANGYAQAVSGGYFKLNGTSMATPVVSGAAALLLQQNSSLTPDQVKARLMLTAYKSFPVYSSVTDPTTGTVYTDYYDIFTVGAGYLDIAAALSSTALATGTALSPTAAFNSKTGTATLVPAAGSIWNTADAVGIADGLGSCGSHQQ